VVACRSMHIFVVDCRFTSSIVDVDFRQKAVVDCRQKGKKSCDLHLVRTPPHPPHLSHENGSLRVSYLVTVKHVVIRHQEKETLPDIINQSTKDRSTHARNVTTRQHKRLISSHTSRQYTKGRSTNAGNVTTRQLQRVISPHISRQYMKGRSTNAGNVTTSQLQRVISPNTSKQSMKARSTNAKTVIHNLP
jgi:hypothetical protein